MTKDRSQKLTNDKSNLFLICCSLKITSAVTAFIFVENCDVGGLKKKIEFRYNREIRVLFLTKWNLVTLALFINFITTKPLLRTFLLLLRMSLLTTGISNTHHMCWWWKARHIFCFQNTHHFHLRFNIARNQKTLVKLINAKTRRKTRISNQTNT